MINLHHSFFYFFVHSNNLCSAVWYIYPMISILKSSTNVRFTINTFPGTAHYWYKNTRIQQVDVSHCLRIAQNKAITENSPQSLCCQK